MYQINFYVPESHLESVKQAMFKAGAGRYAGYDCCAWQVLGEGQYRPKIGAEPYQGKVGQIAKALEYRVEMVCEDLYIDEVTAALLAAHPYEVPAYFVIHSKLLR